MKTCQTNRLNRLRTHSDKGREFVAESGTDYSARIGMVGLAAVGVAANTGFVMGSCLEPGWNSDFGNLRTPEMQFGSSMD